MSKRAWVTYLAVGLAATAAYLAVLGAEWAGQAFNVIGLSASVAIVAGVRMHRPADPRPWYLLAIGQGLFVGGDIVAYNYRLLFGGELPFPSIADALYLAVYPALVAGLWIFVRQRRSGSDRTAFIDTAILLVGAGTLSWVFLIEPYAVDPSLTISLKLTSIAYPLMDLAVLGMMVRLAVGGGRRTPAFRLLMLGVFSLLVTDAVFGWLLLNTSFETGGPLDLGWALFYLLLGAAALHPSMRRLTESSGQPESRQRLVLLAGAALVAPAIQATTNLAGQPGDTALLAAGSASMFILVLFRMRRLMVDLSEHRRTEARLYDAQERYRTLIEGLPAVVYSAELGPEGRWVYVSPRVEAVLGHTQEAWMADPFLWERSVHAEDLPVVVEEVTRAARTGERFVAVYRFRAGDGRERWIRDEASVSADGAGERPIVRGVMYDVTEQHLAEERLRDALEREQAATAHLRELDDMKNSILNAVSHELRTPLTSILGMSRLLQDSRSEIDDDDAARFVERIGANAQRLNRLIADLLDLDRLTRGILEPNRQPIELPQAVERVLEEVGMDGRTLDVRVAPVIADVDAAQFERVVVNLVSNAIRYSPSGAPVLLRVEAGTDEIEVVVEDTGPGVADAQKQSIFEPFRQGEHVVAHSPGVGIGLSLVAKFASLHGGRAWVEDRRGGGASFHATLANARVRSLPLAPADV